MRTISLNRVSSALVLVGVLAGCGTPQIEGVDYNGEFYKYYTISPLSAYSDEQDVDLPPLAAQSSIEVGDSMVSKSRVRRRTFLDLAEGREVSVQFDKNLNFEFYLPAGVYQPQGIDGTGGRYYSAQTPFRVKYVDRQKPLNPDQGKPYPGGVFIDSSGQSFAYLFWSNHTQAFRLSVPNLRTTVKSVLEPATNASLRRELVYAGRSQSTVNLLYREFLNDMTLPPKNVPLAECFNASKENGNDQDGTSQLHAGVQA